MRIAQVAPLFIRVPPNGPGGIERGVSYITEELVRQGHEVTLFASGDSQTQARLVPGCPQPLHYQDWQVWMMAHMLMLERVFRDPTEFDVIHSHLDYFIAPFARRTDTPTVTTMHNPPLLIDQPLWHEYRDLPVVAISEYQRRESFPWLNWVGVIANSLPADQYTFQACAGEYLAFIGRITPEKGLPDAIAIAQQAGVPIKIAGLPDPLQKEYFETQVRPLLDGPLVDYLGELNEAEKSDFLGSAAALLFPVQWEEPFGLVMVEALACGTPVIATPRGAVPEIITDGENGFLASSVAEAAAAVARLPEISRAACRASFEARFTVSRMAEQYVALYEKLRQGIGEKGA